MAADPVHGPRDIVGAAPAGKLNENLAYAAAGALTIVDRDACRRHAERYSSARSVDQLLSHVAVDEKSASIAPAPS